MKSPAETENVDDAVGRLVITPPVISTNGTRVAVTIVPTTGEERWSDPGPVDEWTGDGWKQIGGFVSSAHGGYAGGRHSSGVYFGDDPAGQ